MSTKKNIIIVEDQGLVQMLIRDSLSRLGYRITGVFASGEELLKNIDSLKVDLILMDISLQGELDGIETASKLLENHDLPVIYLTAYSEYALIDRAKITQPYGYILKPFNDRELEVAVEMALYRHNAEKLRKAYESAIGEMNERFRAAFDMNPLPISISTIEGGVFVDINPAFTAVTGYTKEELTGRNSLKLSLWNDEKDRANFISDLLEDGAADNHEALFRSKAGRVFMASISGRIITLDGKPHILAIAEDISKRKEMEEALRENEERIRLLSDNLPGGLVYQIDSGETGQERRFTYISAGVEKLHGITREEALADPMSIYGQVVEQERSVIAELEADAVANSKPLKAELRLQLPSGDLRWRYFSSAPRRLPNRHLVYDGIEIDITERKRMEEALRESEERIRLLSDNLPNGLVYQVDTGETGQERRFTYISAGVEKLHGITREAALNDAMAIYGQIVEEDLKPLRKREVEAIKTKTSFASEARIRMPSGEVRWRFFMSAPRELSNRHIVWDGIEIDITDQKQMEEELRASKQRLTLHLNQTPLAVIEWDLDFRVRDWNPAAERIFGYSREEATGQHSSFIVPLSVREHVHIVWQELVSRKTSVDSVNENVTKNSQRITCEWFNTPLIDERGSVIGVASLVRDITRQKEAEQLLKTSEERFRAHYMNYPLPSYTWRKEGVDFIFIDHNIAANALVHRGIDFRQGDRASKCFEYNPLIIEDFRSCIRKKTVVTAERALLDNSGTVMRHVATHVFVPPDMIMVHVEDVTEKRLAEEVLEDSDKLIKRAIEVHSLRGGQGSDYASAINLGKRAAFADITTTNPKMYSIFQYCEVIGTTGEHVLISGETGVGKELLARAIHCVSGRKGELVTVNAAGLDDTAFSDTLFGHVRGAFTGAETAREGLITRAKDGTLFLDEIGDLSDASQIKLLRLLQEMEYYPLGADKPKKSSARLIMATNRDLKWLVARGAFRNDLYYRVCSHHIIVPPLRERIDDLPLLLGRFINEAAKKLRKKPARDISGISGAMASYDFPGNVRELRGLVFECMARFEPGRFTECMKDLTGRMKKAAAEEAAVQADRSSLRAYFGRMPTLKELEERVIAEALVAADNDQGTAAAMIGLTRQALNKRLLRKAGKRS